MLRAKPIRREANHEDAVVLDLDRIAGTGRAVQDAWVQEIHDPVPGAFPVDAHVPSCSSRT
jgi:hypothetical protein